MQVLTRSNVDWTQDLAAGESVNGGEGATGLTGLRKKVHSNRSFT
jgi:hypothetical protein